MNSILRLLKGDTVSDQYELEIVAQKIFNAVNKGYDFIQFSYSEKIIFIPILKGLDIPFIDCDSNGILIGDSYDIIKPISNTI